MIKPTCKVRHTRSDTKYLIKALDQLKSMHVKNGVIAGTGAHPNSKAGATIAAIAAWNEFGTPRIPSRPFMRNGYREFKEDRALIRDILLACVFTKKGVYLRKNPNVKMFFNICGMEIQAHMVNQITNGSSNFKEGAASTVAAKEAKGGSDTPLFDTGALKQAISYEVVRN